MIPAFLHSMHNHGNDMERKVFLALLQMRDLLFAFVSAGNRAGLCLPSGLESQGILAIPNGNIQYSMSF